MGRRSQTSPANRGAPIDQAVRDALHNDRKQGNDGIVCFEYELPNRIGLDGRKTPREVQQVISRMPDVRLKVLRKGKRGLRIKVMFVSLRVIRWWCSYQLRCHRFLMLQ